MRSGVCRASPLFVALASVAVVALFHLHVAAASTLSYQKVQVIDFNATTGNFLFRGNEPINSTGQFAYEELVSYMKQRAANASLVLPDSFYLVDLTFINRVQKDERNDLKVEMQFFEDNPQLGEVAHHFLMGTLRPPSLYRSDKRMELASTLPEWMVDQLPQLEMNVRDLLGQQQQQPVVIYAHCEAGTDRTGEFSAAYYMQFQGMTLQEAVATDESISGRAMHRTETWATEWFCWYLTTIGYNLTCKM